MKTNYIIKIGLFGFLPIFIGGFIYIINRTETILFFNWIKAVQMENGIKYIRDLFGNYHLSEWIKFNLPDLLWVFGFTSVMLIIWKEIQSQVKMLYIILPLVIAETSEIVQYFIPTFGTFDFKDIIFYSIGWILSILILKTINQLKNEKQITTSI
ncbi:hypothetical protein [Psychroserpens sp.]|uniref:hypothetical protein n=1 Tax=Psychroserpens sp. TaxID=2020870 RepID=UPI002B26C38B|nr:hypothetical protein [Psychroserpens sp.]